MKKALFLSVLFVSTAAFAQMPPSRQAASGNAHDPNETICRTITNTGSRLSRSRICMTRAQWEDYRRTTRQALEQSQTNRRPAGDN